MVKCWRIYNISMYDMGKSMYISYFTHLKCKGPAMGMIPLNLTMIPVRENSEVVIIWPNIIRYIGNPQLTPILVAHIHILVGQLISILAWIRIAVGSIDKWICGVFFGGVSGKYGYLQLDDYLGLSRTSSILPSGKHTKNYGKSPFFMGKSTINGHFQ